MTKLTAILGKSGSGKTFVAAHIAMAFSYLGVKTLLIGCDQKQDVGRAVTGTKKSSLMEALETHRFDYLKVTPADILTPVTPYLDGMELGPSPLLSGSYGGVFDEMFHYLKIHRLGEGYAQILLDVGDDRFDGVLLPLIRKTRWVVGVTEETAESLFVLNRLMRAVLIGGYEYHYPARMVGVIHNRSTQPLAFNRYVERTKAFPLMSVPELTELSNLRPHHTTLFAMKQPPKHLDDLVGGFIKVAELLRGEPFNLYPMVPLPDEEIWGLAPMVPMPS
ncbi:MAG: hypothetical protein OEW12_02370 [Deltaproteobacteria bacterium]|nr:hypothetical protein [Deltaproteobacteria bacterium]